MIMNRPLCLSTSKTFLAHNWTALPLPRTLITLGALLVCTHNLPPLSVLVASKPPLPQPPRPKANPQLIHHVSIVRVRNAANFIYFYFFGKRSPAARVREHVSRKVQVSDFEMMRVLGKGCAGKVLLVRHKSTLDLYALKAITKRHVLAHQELQHSLTEQAVLRRMSAEGTDPFVVKLWWSFHDKENLFLVMVRMTCIRMPCFQEYSVDIDRNRTSILVVILPHSWHGGVALGATVLASMLLKLLRVSRACMLRVSSIVTSSQRTFLLLPMATSYSLTLACRRSSRVALRNTPRQLPHRLQEHLTG
jgi:Protein kinase domain